MAPITTNGFGKRPRSPEVHAEKSDNNEQKEEDVIDHEPSAKIARRPSSPLELQSKSATVVASASASLLRRNELPLAPRLVDFMADGGTCRYRPRPEWCSGSGFESSASGGEQQQRHHSVHSMRSGRLSRATLSESVPQDANIDRIARRQRDNNRLLAQNHSLLHVAPDNGLLPDGTFRDYLPGSLSHSLSHPHSADEEITVVVSNSNRNAAVAATTEATDLESTFLSMLDTAGSVAVGAISTAPSTFGRDFDPALHVAIRENATEAALALIECGAQVDAENAKGVTPVILASQKGNFVLVRELLRRGASPSTTSVNGTTAVMQAAHFGHCDVLELLLHRGGTNLMEVANYNHTTPLMRAAQEGHENIVKMLLDRGAAVNRRNRVQMTALMLASQRGHARICKLLVRYGADLDSMTAKHSTSLLLACIRANVEVVQVLVTAGCELWVKDARGRTAREVAQRRNLKQLVQILDSSVQINLMQRQGRQQRSYDMIRLWNLLQQERATIPIDDGDRNRRQVSIHQVQSELDKSNLPHHLCQKSNQALLRTMTLPAPLVEAVAAYLPLPHLWEKRIRMLMKRSMINADAAVTCTLDLIDEVLEEGGFVEACDYAKVTPPTHFGSWREWKAYGRLRRQALSMPHESNVGGSRIGAASTAKQISAVEFRRQVGFLQILAYRSPLLGRFLAAPPYNMPLALVKQLITSSDIQSLVRRMGSRGVHFESPVAMDLIMLASRLCSWYNREHEGN